VSVDSLHWTASAVGPRNVSLCCRAVWKVGRTTNTYSGDDQVLTWAHSQSLPGDLFAFSRSTRSLSVFRAFQPESAVMLPYSGTVAL
jgi:hypothetical protein